MPMAKCVNRGYPVKTTKLLDMAWQSYFLLKLVPTKLPLYLYIFSLSSLILSLTVHDTEIKKNKQMHIMVCILALKEVYQTSNKLTASGAIDFGNTSLVQIQDSFILLFFVTGTGMQTLETQAVVAFCGRLFLEHYFVSKASVHATHLRLNKCNNK